MFKRKLSISLLALASAGSFVGVSFGQVLFEDDFDDGAIDTTKWRLDDKPFETGGGDFEAVEADGVLTLEGQATKNWWGGLALATIPTFEASADAPLTFEVERMIHERVDHTSNGAGEDSSTRTSIWITDASRQNFVLFSQNANEDGWTYNKKVGDPDDNATNRGINIAEFDDRDQDFGEHLMEMEANGESVQLFLDGDPGPVVSFPFSEGIVFQIGVYARRGEGAQPTDSVTGVFDNVFITGPTAQCVSLTPPFTETLQGEAPELTLQIPQTAPRPVSVTITSSAPDVAIPSGAVDGALTVRFNEADEPSRIISVEVSGEGLAEFTVTSDLELCAAEPVRVFAAAVLLEDDFEDGDFDAVIWRDDFGPFEDGDGAFDIVEEGGVITLSGEAEEPFWAGVAVMTQGTFSPTPESPVRFQIDMTLTSAGAGIRRSGVWVADCDREDYVFFSFDGTSDWTANSTTTDLWPRDGGGQLLQAFECCGFENPDITRRVELLTDGESVTLFMDGIDGGKAPFEFDNVSFGFGAYALSPLDSVNARFDNVRILGEESAIGDTPCGGPVGPRFVRGDPDNSGASNITDAIVTLGFLFGGEGEPSCLEAADIDNDGMVNLSDPVRLLGSLFGADGAPPAPPVGACGPDPAAPTLNCVYTKC